MIRILLKDTEIFYWHELELQWINILQTRNIRLVLMVIFIMLVIYRLPYVHVLSLLDIRKRNKLWYT